MVRISRRKILISFFAVSAVFAVILAYGRFIEPRWLAVDRQVVRLGKVHATEPITILHLADLHASKRNPYSFLQKAIEKGLAEKPDIICLTGDYISWRIFDRERYLAILSRLPSAAPTFACLGNHDGGWTPYPGFYTDPTEVKALLKDSGITCLTNDYHDVTIRGQTLRIVGLGDLWAGGFDPKHVLSPAHESTTFPVVVLSHNPDTKDLLRDYAWDLMLSGHSHGGQVWLPLVGPLVPTVKHPEFSEGLHAWEGRWIYTTHGVGTLRGMRLNCRPQVSILQLESAE